ncbi:hypothetical protein ADUPG1_010482 [Aduncisulcus paluster]|uniref:NOT2/NOT3/NOT5 C-terminal domain-containing protein n=1 Tax=Aduncisulcus paluster TaxID=2918883 RepID=A0ABQ5JS16_9EUKA|nr:hypothetical protein ADUPG1_010482 [Aduncisulcus paluster]
MRPSYPPMMSHPMYYGVNPSDLPSQQHFHQRQQHPAHSSQNSQRGDNQKQFKITKSRTYPKYGIGEFFMLIQPDQAKTEQYRIRIGYSDKDLGISGPPGSVLKRIGNAFGKVTQTIPKGLSMSDPAFKSAQPCIIDPDVSKIPIATLVYQFFTLIGNRRQLVAAKELYKRGLRFVRNRNVWIFKPDGPPLEQSSGVCVVQMYDIKQWNFVPIEIDLRTTIIEGPPKFE